MIVTISLRPKLSDRFEVIPWNRNLVQEQEFRLSDYLLPLLPATALLSTHTAHAADPMVKQSIIQAFEPLVELAQGVAYPLALLFGTGGMLVWISGNRLRGLEMLRNAAAGYLGIQMLPAIMQIVASVGDSMRQSMQAVG